MTNLRSLRHKYGISQAVVAGHSRLNCYTFGLVESGRLIPTPEQKLRIREALRHLGVDADDIRELEVEDDEAK